MAISFDDDMKTPAVIHMESTEAGTGPVDDMDNLVLERGHIILEDEQHMGILKLTKIHWRAILICCTAFTSGLLFGYDTIVNGASISMPAFFIYFGDIGPTGPYLPSVWTSLWVAMSNLTQALGAFIVGFASDRYGRKWPAVVAGILTMIGTAVQFTATSRGALLGGKMVAGFGIGTSMSSATSYASEVAPQPLVRVIQSALVLFTVLMQGVALGVIRIYVPDIAPSAFRTVFAIQWAVGGLSIVAWIFTPESPVFLVVKERLSQAQKVMSQIYGPSNDPEARLAILVKSVRDERASSTSGVEQGSYFECFRGTDLRRTVAAMLIYGSANLAGAAFLSQAIYFLIVSGLEAIHAFDVSIGGFGLACLIIVASWLVAGKVKNRTAFNVGLILNFIVMLIVGCLYYSSNRGALWATAVLMSVQISFQTSMLQGLGFPIAAELSKLRLRAKTISLCIIFQTSTTWLTTFIMPYIYNVDAGNLLGRTGFIFAGTSILLFIASWFLIPDTSNMDVEELDAAYAQKIPARRIRSGCVRNLNVGEESFGKTGI